MLCLWPAPGPAGAPALAQGGCAAPSGVAASAPAAPAGSGAISLSYRASLGGDSNAAAALGQLGPYLFSRGADLLMLAPPSTEPVATHLPDTVRDIAVGEAAIYVASGAGGLQVISRLNNQILGALLLPGLASAIALDGQLAYLAAAGPGGGLQIVDVADPARPRLLASAPTFGSASGLALAGGLAYVAGGQGGGVEIFDVSSPGDPRRLGGLITPGAARGVALAGGRAYVAADSCGLQVLDVSDPAAPVLLGAASTGGPALALQVAEGLAYVAAGSAGLQVFDLGASPPALVAARGFAPGAQIRDVFVTGAMVHLAAGPAGAIALQAQIPGLAPLTSASTIGGVRAARAANGSIYMALGQGLVAESASFSNSALQGQARSDRPSLGVALGPSIGQDQIIYSADGSAGVSVIRATGGLQLGSPAALALPGSATMILLDGDRAYVAGGTAGVHIVDLSDPLRPALTRTIDTPGAALDIALAGGLLYVADRSGLQVLDPAGATVGGYAAPAGSFVQGVAISGAVAYLADRGGLAVVAIGDPAAPTLIGSLPGFELYDLAAQGDRLFAAAGKDGALAFDISDPAAPRLAGRYDSPGTALGVTPDGDTLLVADSEGGLLRLGVTEMPNQLRLPLVGR